VGALAAKMSLGADFEGCDEAIINEFLAILDVAAGSHNDDQSDELVTLVARPLWRQQQQQQPQQFDIAQQDLDDDEANFFPDAVTWNQRLPEATEHCLDVPPFPALEWQRSDECFVTHEHVKISESDVEDGPACFIMAHGRDTIPAGFVSRCLSTMADNGMADSQRATEVGQASMTSTGTSSEAKPPESKEAAEYPELASQGPRPPRTAKHPGTGSDSYVTKPKSTRADKRRDKRQRETIRAAQAKHSPRLPPAVRHTPEQGSLLPRASMPRAGTCAETITQEQEPSSPMAADPCARAGIQAEQGSSCQMAAVPCARICDTSVDALTFEDTPFHSDDQGVVELVEAYLGACRTLAGSAAKTTSAKAQTALSLPWRVAVRRLQQNPKPDKEVAMQWCASLNTEIQEVLRVEPGSQ